MWANGRLGRPGHVFLAAACQCCGHRKWAGWLGCFYEQDVKDRFSESGLTTAERIKRNTLLLSLAQFIHVLFVVPVLVYFVHGKEGSGTGLRGWSGSKCSCNSFLIFPCAVSPEPGTFCGPGKKGDCCHCATFVMMDLLSQIPAYRESRVAASTADDSTYQKQTG